MVLEYQQTKSPELLTQIVENRGYTIDYQASVFAKSDIVKQRVGDEEDIKTELKQVLLRSINHYNPDYNIDFGSYYFNNSQNHFNNVKSHNFLQKNLHNGVYSIDAPIDDSMPGLMMDLPSKPHREYLDDKDLLQIAKLLSLKLPRTDFEEVHKMVRHYYIGDDYPQTPKKHSLITRLRQINNHDRRIRAIITKYI